MADEEPTGAHPDHRLREALARKDAEDKTPHLRHGRGRGRYAVRWCVLGVALLLGALGAHQLPATGYWLWGLLHSLTAGIGAAGVYALIVGARYRGLEVGWRRRQLLANHEIHWAYTRGFDAGWAAPGQARGDDV